jgi:hypothetical protein
LREEYRLRVLENMVLSDQLKKNETAGSCGMYGGKEKCM